MCGLCGLMGDGGAWSDTLNAGDQAATRLARQRRTKLLNALLVPQHAKVRTLADGALLVQGPTGRQVVVRSFTSFWAQLQQIGITPPDLLSPGFLAHALSGR
jgi:hypothetical protein